MTWTPLIAFFVLIVIYAIGNEISLKTKSVLSLVLVSCILHLIGYWTGIIPLDSVASTGLPLILSAFVLPVGVTNLGTMINVNQLLGEWKTVIVCLVGLVGLAIACFTVGCWLFGREYALVAAGPIAGGGVATIIIGDACEAAGRGDLAGYAALINSTQILISTPIAGYLLKVQLSQMQREGKFLSEQALHAGEKHLPPIRRRSWQNAPAWWTRPYPLLARTALVAVIAYAVYVWTGIPQAICCLVFGVIACQFGFLEPDSMQKAGFWGFMMIVQLSNIPNMLKSVTWARFQTMILPVFGMLLLGAVSLALFGILTGKLLRLPWKVSVSIALCAMLGYPPTMLLSEDAVATMDGTDEERSVARGYILPKMLVGGFTTVSMASVAFASIIAPMIFS